MRLVIVSFYKAYPPVSGAASVSYNVAKYLPGIKHLIQLGNENKSQKLEDAFYLHSFRYVSDKYLLKMLYLIVRIPKILALIRRLAPEVILLEGASWSVYYLMLFYLLKLFSLRSKIVYHAHIVEHVLRKKKNNALIAWITKWAERILMTRSDFSTAVSKVDAHIFLQTFGFRPYVFLNGVDTKKFSSIRENQIKIIKTKYRLHGKIVLFMGLVTFGPNKEAVNFLINDIFPKVVAKYNKARLAIIGGQISEKRDWLINPGCIPFEEVPAFINASDICVAPIFSGSGTRLKILEYMAAQKPVISTSKGAEGLAVEDEKNIYIGNTAEEFIKKILFLINHPTQAKRIASEGRKMVARYYSWETIIRSFFSKLEEIVESD